MLNVWTIAAVAVVVLPFVVEYVFRIYIARKIRGVIESVPPLAIIEALPADNGHDLVAVDETGAKTSATVFCLSSKPAAVVIFCPELDGKRQSALLYCRPLVEAGFAVVSVGMGEAEADEPMPIHWTAETEISAVERVLNHISNLDQFRDLPIGMFGVSRGGTAAIICACRFPQIRSVVTDSGYSSMGLTRNFIARFGRQLVPEALFNVLPQWHISKALWHAFRLSENARGCRYVHIEHEASSFTQPILMISGKRDSYVTPPVTDNLARLLGNSNTWVVARAKHNKARLQAEADYAQKIVEHFTKTLNVSDQSNHCQASVA